MNMIEKLRLNLQFFSADKGGTVSSNASSDNPGDTKNDDDEVEVSTKDDQPKDDEPKFTQKQLDKIVQDRVNRLEQDKQDAIDEAKKLAKMNADEKREYEFEKLQEENKRLLAEQNRYSLGKEATKILAESNIVATDEILEFVVREDADKTSAAVKAFSDLVDKVSDERMKEKLKGKSPKKQTSQQSTMTKTEIMKVQDTGQRQKLIKENIHLFQ